MSIKNLTEQNFKQEVLNAGQPVLVDFYADWCGPCKALTPVLTELATEFQGRATVGKVNIDEQAGLATEYGISSIPTLLLFKDGKLANKLVGLRSKKDLKAFFE
jgi:thioredoxin 1